MNLLDMVVLSVHALFGVLWFLSLFILTLSINASVKSGRTHKGMFKQIMFSRSTGGLAIILGIILVVLIEASGNKTLFSGTSGMVLVVAIVLAVIAYVFVAEGFLFRKINAITRRNGNTDSGSNALTKEIRTISVVLTLLVLLIIVLMVVSTSL
ncbi:MAG: hypothetical protein AAE977_01925 [Thermoplasmataceae archaeon]|jgi:hypothetical protein